MGRKVLIALLTCISLLVIAGCEKTIVYDGDGNTPDPSTFIWDTSEVVSIVLDDKGITADHPAVYISGSVVTILKGGTYSISGSLSDGRIFVNSKEDSPVRIFLNGTSVRSLSGSPFYIKNSQKTVISLNDGTQNTFADASGYLALTDGEPNAAIFSNSYLAIGGSGSLTVTGNYLDGISSDDELVISGGKISVTAADDGIRGKDYLLIRDGNINVVSKGDGLKSDNEADKAPGYIIIEKGQIKVSSSAGDAVSSKGSITIKDGSLELTSGGGAATVTFSTGGGFPGGPGGGGPGSGGYSGTVSAKALKTEGALIIEKGTFILNSADDAIHSHENIEINGGTISIASGDDALHADQSVTVNGGTINVTKCYEGFESPSISVTKGEITLVSADDSFNATMGTATEANDGSMLSVSGGTIVLNSTGGDCIDSNGNVTMTGGTIIAHGPPSAPEVGIDVNGTFNISGGLLLATGPNSGNMIEAVSTSSPQYCIKATISSGLGTASLFHLEDASGRELITYKPVRNLYYLVFSSPELAGGSSYSIYTGGTESGTNSNGVYSYGGYSGGTLKKSFSVTSKVTSVSF